MIRSLILTALILLVIVPIRAQVHDARGTESTPSAAATPEPVPEAQLSPRATMRSFLTSVIGAGESSDSKLLDKAAACLDLTDVNPLVRQEEGRRLAIKLKGVLDRIEKVEYQTLPDDPDYSGIWVYPREEAIRIARQPDGAWKFDGKTVAAIGDLYSQYEEKSVVSGVAASGEELLPEFWLRSKVPSYLRHKVFLLENWQWLALLLLTLAGVVVDRLVTAFAQQFLLRRLQRWLKDVDAALMRTSLRPYGLVAMAVVWRLAVGLLDLPADVLAALVVAVRFVGVTGFVWGSYRMVDVATEALRIRSRRTETRFDDLLVPLFHRSLKIFIAVFGIVFIADTMNVPIASLLAGLGLGGLAFAFAAQDLVANLFGSLTIVLDRPFEVGDWVVIGDIDGSVELVGFRSTRIRTFYDSLVTVPNSQINTAAVDNYGRRRYRRWSTKLSLTYDTSPEKIEAFVEGVREIIRRHPHTRKDYFHVYLNEFGAASLDVLLYVFFAVPDWGAELAERHRLAVDIVRLAERLGVEFAFPTQTLYLKRGQRIEPHQGKATTAEDVEGALEWGRSEARTAVERILGPSSDPAEGT